ncbi:MAG: PHP domain-containing protein [bacterium]|nr:PHP domain-containing protein [bacterium]
MELTYDLHIHSCLSPCGDEDMTPANIAGMAALKGLDVVALTDHNSCRNCPAFLHFAEEYGVLAIAGMEVTTAEEIHAVCLFPTLEAALRFDSYVYERLLPFPNDELIFGKQQIYGKEDTVTGKLEKLLINSTDISIDHLWELAASYGGVMFPAHIDKDANSLLASLGAIPPDSKFQSVELKQVKKLHELKRQHPYLEHCRILCNSDAHYLEQIHEPEWVLPVRERSVEAVLETIRKGLFSAW